MKVTGWTVVLFVAGLTLGIAAPAHAAPGESISSYDTRIEVRTDGQLLVNETIAYDFGTGQRHGIFRKIPTRFHWDGTRDRIYPIDDITVTMDDRPVKFRHGADGGYEVIQIGDPDTTITGIHTYAIGYTLRGALNHFTDHEELYWNLIGPEWQVPIDDVTATVTGPAAIVRWDCFVGPVGSHDRCAEPTVSGDTARFHQAGLGNGAVLTAVLAFPVGSVAAAGPILTDRHDLASAFHLTLWTGLGAAGLILLCVGVTVVIAWRVGRDRRFVGTLPGLVPEEGDRAVEELKPLVGAPPVSVEFVPPDDIRPAQVGALTKERVEVVEITATIVDFAVRGLLRIRELREPGAERPHDWALEKLTEADRRFTSYESTLFRALFADRDEVRLSKLRGKFGFDVRKVREQLYTDLIARNWYRYRPDEMRKYVRGRAFLIFHGALAVTIALGFTIHLGLLGIGPLAGAVTLFVLAGRFPARTGTGSAVLERVRGLRLYIETTEAEQIRFQEREQIFSRYLPYAMVFGLTERWARTFAGLAATGVVATSPYWYSGAAYGQASFGDTFGHFTSTAIGSVGAIPVAGAGGSGFGSGGFSGGGGGGGGGGSW